MAIYKTSDLLEKILEIINDGYSLVDVMELECDEEFPTSLSFSAAECEDGFVDYECVESVEYSDSINYSHAPAKLSDPCPDAVFTYKELLTLMHSVDLALDYLKEASSKPLSEENLSALKESTTDFHNLQAKFRMLRNMLGISKS